MTYIKQAPSLFPVMATSRITRSVHNFLSACGRKGGKAGKKTDKSKAGLASGKTRRQKSQERIDQAWSEYKRERNGGGITSKALYVKTFFPRVRHINTAT